MREREAVRCLEPAPCGAPTALASELTRAGIRCKWMDHCTQRDLAPAAAPGRRSRGEGLRLCARAALPRPSSLAAARGRGRGGGGRPCRRPRPRAGVGPRPRAGAGRGARTNGRARLRGGSGITAGLGADGVGGKPWLDRVGPRPRFEHSRRLTRDLGYQALDVSVGEEVLPVLDE